MATENADSPSTYPSDPHRRVKRSSAIQREMEIYCRSRCCSRDTNPPKRNPPFALPYMSMVQFPMQKFLLIPVRESIIKNSGWGQSYCVRVRRGPVQPTAKSKERDHDCILSLSQQGVTGLGGAPSGTILWRWILMTSSFEAKLFNRTKYTLLTVGPLKNPDFPTRDLVSI